MYPAGPIFLNAVRISGVDAGTVVKRSVRATARRLGEPIYSCSDTDSLSEGIFNFIANMLRSPNTIHEPGLREAGDPQRCRRENDAKGRVRPDEEVLRVIRKSAW